MLSNDHVTKYMRRIRPWSLQAIAFAITLVALGMALRMIFAMFGATLYFVSFFPFVLIASVFAGTPAGLLTTTLSILIVCWEFVPPESALAQFSQSDYGNFALFLTSALLMIWLCHLYRTALENLLRSEDARELLIRELNHRAANTFALVQSIIKGTLKHDKVTAEKLSERIGALARSNALFSKNHDQVSLEQIIRAEAAPYVNSMALQLDGPPLQLDAQVGRNVALVIHELTTNSAKYGALSNAQGTLQVHWKEMDGSCVLFWTEEDGPAVTTPSRNGFGTLMIKATLANIEGEIEPEFCPSGYRCVLSFRKDPGSKKHLLSVGR